jgi:hypothetical protein
MGFGRNARRMASGASVALTTAGLSTCHDNGAVDPPPPPFQCTDEVRTLESLTEGAAATLKGTELHVTFWGPGGTWESAQVTEVAGGTARPVTLAQPLEVVIDLTDDMVTQGSFKLTGVVQGPNSVVCEVGRTFIFRINFETGTVNIARAEDLPLSRRQPAGIALASRAGREVELVPGKALTGATSVVWTVTGGDILASDSTRLRWRLPVEAGLYQVELIADYGPPGFSHDVLILEVV